MLRRQLVRCYRRYGKSEKYVLLLSKYKKLFVKTKEDFLSNNVEKLRKSNPKKFAVALKRIGVWPRDYEGIEWEIQ